MDEKDGRDSVEHMLGDSHQNTSSSGRGKPFESAAFTVSTKSGCALVLRVGVKPKGPPGDRISGFLIGKLTKLTNELSAVAHSYHSATFHGACEFSVMPVCALAACLESTSWVK
jgi:hypothetical protein